MERPVLRMQKRSFEVSVQDTAARGADERAGLRQFRGFARLFMPLLVLPLMYAVFLMLRESPAALFASRTFAGLYWFSTCILVVAASRRRRWAIRDAGLRTFYILAVSAVALMLALNMTGLV